MTEPPDLPLRLRAPGLAWGHRGAGSQSGGERLAPGRASGASLDTVEKNRYKKEATEAGRLGGTAKVATIYPNRLNKDSSKRVICVYTYDWTDEVDVRRVREALRELGFTWKLAYKADRDTLEGRYRHRGDPRISKYYE